MLIYLVQVWYFLFRSNMFEIVDRKQYSMSTKNTSLQDIKLVASFKKNYSLSNFLQ